MDIKTNITTNEQVNNSASAAGNTTAAAASSNSNNNSILAAKKPKEELLKQLGITVEQYVEICNANPNFETLPLEKQLEFISKYNTQNAPQAAEASQVAAATETPAESEAVSEQQAASSAADSNAASSESSAESPFFNKAKFAKLSVNDKMNVYVEEYAKNSFMFADNDNVKTSEEWDALSEEEKLKYINTAKDSLKTKFSDVLNSTSDVAVGIALDGMMTDLLAANHNQMRVKQFYGEEKYDDFTFEQLHREEAVYSYLNEVDLIEKDMKCPSSMSDLDKARLEKERLLANAVGSVINDENICPSEARRYLKSNNLSEYEVELAYLENLDKKSKENPDVTLSDFEKNRLALLRDLNKSPEFQLAIKESKYQGLQNLKKEREEALVNGETERVESIDKVLNKEESKAIEKWAESRDKKPVETPQEFEEFKNSQLGKLYSSNSDSDSRAAILMAYLQENVEPEKRAEVAAKLSQGLEAEGPDSLETNIKFLQAGLAAKRYAATMAKEANLSNVNIANNNNIKNGVETDKHTLKTIQNRNSDAYNSAKSEEEKNEYKDIIVNSANVMKTHGSDENKATTVESYHELSSNDEIGQVLTDLNYSNKNAELERRGIDQISKYGSDNVKIYGARNAHKALEGNQNYALKAYTEGSKAATKAVAEEGTYTKFAESEQLDGMNTTNQRIEENFEGQERIDLLKVSADYIKDAAVSNQLEMHKTVMNSKYDEVVQHASSNIHKYDESVQADAIKSTYDTGNQKAIDAANAQLDKCSPDAVKSISSEVAEQTKATETKYAQEVAKQVADFHNEYQKITGSVADENLLPDENEQKVAYVKEFLTATPQEQYKMLSKLPQAWQGTVFSKICQYCPNMLTGLVKQGYGKQILKTPGMPSEVIYKVINTMLTSSDTDKKEAAKYVIQHQSFFTDSTLERCEEFMASSRKSNYQSYTSDPLGGYGSYINKKEVHYKA